MLLDFIAKVILFCKKNILSEVKNVVWQKFCLKSNFMWWKNATFAKFFLLVVKEGMR